jgi:hypothetical protein
MIALANGYFETIERNNGMIRTRFHPHCNRVENGVQTTNNPDFPLPIARLGCEAQFALGWYRYDDELRGRRFPLVDIERGIVLAHGFIDHSGRLGEYELTDGTRVSSPIRRPHSYCLAEAFKIRDGAIEQVEAVFHTVPYRMPSPWEGTHFDSRTPQLSARPAGRRVRDGGLRPQRDGARRAPARGRARPRADRVRARVSPRCSSASASAALCWRRSAIASAGAR